jgi:hypothetical protein
VKWIILIPLGSVVGFILLFLIQHNGRFGEPLPDYYDGTNRRIDTISFVLRDFKNGCGRYPTTEEGLKALLWLPKDLKCPSFEEWTDARYKPYLLKDGWEIPLRYTSDGKNYLIEASHGISKISPSKNSN